MDNLLNSSIVPKDYKKKDPRTLPYLYPESLNVVAYVRSLQKFNFYMMLELAEDMAKKQGFVLLPYACIHWQRAKEYGSDRKIKVGRNTFFLMKPQELTKGEKAKLQAYINDLKQ